MTMVPSPNTTQVFTFPATAQPVRSLMVDGDPWWVARDLGDVLELGNMHSSIALLEDDEKGVHGVETPGGLQQMATVNESGLYSLILRSRKPQAKAFKRWITRDVLPAIRRTGSYSVATPSLPDMSTPQGRIAVAQALLAGAERELELTEKVAELEPKALAHDTFLSAQKGDLLVRQAAKALGWQEKHLRVFLLDEKLIYRRERLCGGGEYDFYASHAEHFNSALTTVEHTWGACAHYTLHVTPRGMVLIQRRIEQQQSAIRASIEGGASR